MNRTSAESFIVAIRQALFSSLSRHSALYAIISLGSRGLPFLLLPILTRYLTEIDFGIYAMFAAILNLLAPLIGFSTVGAVTQQFFVRDRDSFSRYVGASVLILGVSTLGVAVLVALLGPFLSSVTGIPTVWLWAAIGGAVGRFLGQLTQTCYQVQHKPLPYASVLLAQTALIAGISLALVVGLGADWRGRAAADPLAFLFVGLIGIATVAKGGWLRPGHDKDDIRHAIRFGTGAVPHAYGAALLATTDRIILTIMVGLGATGLYAVGAQVAQLIGVLEHSFNLAWVPWLYERLRRGKQRDLARVRQITRIYNVLIVLLSLAFAWSASLFLGPLVGNRFRDAGEFVLWLSLAAAFNGMYKMMVSQLMFAGRTRTLAGITLTAAVGNIPLTIVLVALNGPVGAAQSVAVAQLLLYLMTRRVSNSIMRELEAHGAA